MDPESLHIQEVAGVTIVIAVDSTVLGPALGGCRWRPYPDLASARDDAIALGRAMTRKAALARLRLGGGKAVVIGDPRQQIPEQLHAVGDLVDSLNGRYITAADMGTGEAQMAVIGERTRHVSGLPKSQGGSGGPGPFTAEGVYLAMQAALDSVGRSLSGATIAIQGVGNVGFALARLLHAAGSKLIVSDTNTEPLEKTDLDWEVVRPEAITAVECDVFAPCGPPDVIDAGVADSIPCRVICGAANNPLTSTEVAAKLRQRGILYVPDFLANAGGLIHLGIALEGGDEAASRDHLRVIASNLETVLQRSAMEDITTAAAAENLALAAIAKGEQV